MNFTSKQREIVARKLGYDGPMQGFDEYLKSSPALMMKYNAVSDKYTQKMAKGGVVRKRYADGGAVTSPSTVEDLYKQYAGREADTEGATYWKQQFGDTIDPEEITRFQTSITEARKTGTEAIPTTSTVEDLYRQYAGREPDEAGMLWWKQQFGDSIDTKEVTRFQTSIDEARKAGTEAPASIDQMYELYANRQADPEGLAYWKQQFGDTIDLNEAKQFRESIDYARKTGTEAIPTTLTVEDLYRQYAGREPDEAGMLWWKQQFGDSIDTKEAAQFADWIKYATNTLGTEKGGTVGGGGVTYSETGVPIPGKAATVTPSNILSSTDQFIDPNAPEYKLADATQVKASTATAEQATTPTSVTAKTYDTTTVKGDMDTALAGMSAKTGVVSDKAQVIAQTGAISPQSLATAATVGKEYIQPVTAEKRVTGAGELVTAVTEEQAPQVTAAQTTAPAKIEAAQGVVREEELAKAAQIREEDMAQATAITADGLAPDAIAVAARLEKFSVDDGTLAEFIQGNVDASATVQGQLAQLMKSFDDGATPAWAAGAIRAANAAMSARGLGGSSMAGAAIFQAAMESALPIASQDAQTFNQMGLTNLNNRQQVALANAAAQQGLQLQNLNNEQQAALQNSANAFALQSQNLSNMQQVMVANAQIRASLQQQNLSNQQQANLAQAARYAEMANINLNNIQQARLQDSTNALNVDLANLSNRQQAYVVNAQLQAALQAKNLDNKQQAAVLNAARIAENNNMTFTAAQQAALHNSTLMQTIGLAEMNAQQAATLANAATYAAMDMANLNNRQQAAVVNAQTFLQMDMANLNNEQQMAMFKAQATSQALLSDQAAKNAAAQFNAASQNEMEQFNTKLASDVSMFNAAQKNAISQFNVDQENAIAKFNADIQNQRDMFNSQQRLIIDKSNAEWRREISTANTAATNAAYYINAQNLQQMTMAEYNNQTQLYRDQVEMAWSSFEKDADRANQIVLQQIQASGSLAQAQAAIDAAAAGEIGKFVTGIFGEAVKPYASAAVSTVGEVIEEGVDWLGGFTGLW